MGQELKLYLETEGYLLLEPRHSARIYGVSFPRYRAWRLLDGDTCPSAYMPAVARLCDKFEGIIHDDLQDREPRNHRIVSLEPKTGNPKPPHILLLDSAVAALSERADVEIIKILRSIDEIIGDNDRLTKRLEAHFPGLDVAFAQKYMPNRISRSNTFDYNQAAWRITLPNNSRRKKRGSRKPTREFANGLANVLGRLCNTDGSSYGSIRVTRADAASVELTINQVVAEKLITMSITDEPEKMLLLRTDPAGFMACAMLQKASSARCGKRSTTRPYAT